MTISGVRGDGRQKDGGQEYLVDLLPKIRSEMVVPAERPEDAVIAIRGAAHSGNIGDGKIFVSVAEVARISTGDRAEFTL